MYFKIYLLNSYHLKVLKKWLIPGIEENFYKINVGHGVPKSKEAIKN